MGGPATNVGRSDAQLLPAPPDGLAQVTQLVLDDFADRLARRLEVLLHALLDLFGRNVIPELLAALGGPPRSARALLAGPHRAASCAADDRRDRPMAARTTPQQRGRADADEEADERGRQEVVLLLT
jgi:hypothetical protein